jgi:hypothetical protein
LIFDLRSLIFEFPHSAASLFLVERLAASFLAERNIEEVTTDSKKGLPSARSLFSACRSICGNGCAFP